jgi:hypothetical protein
MQSYDQSGLYPSTYPARIGYLPSSSDMTVATAHIDLLLLTRDIAARANKMFAWSAMAWLQIKEGI